MARSVNKVILIGNLTRDPEMRYTPNGQAVVSFGLATNRRWTDKAGEQKEDTEFHNIVAWGKLAELCSQLLKKGRKVYIEGRLQTRSWEGKDGVTRSRTEIVTEDMVVLNLPPKVEGEGPTESSLAPGGEAFEPSQGGPTEPEVQVEEQSEKKPADKKATGGKDEEIKEDEIPF